MVPLKSHNVIDYLIAAMLLLSPFLFGFSDVNGARNLFLVLGLIQTAYSAATQYSYSIFKAISVMAHLFLDVILGFVLIIAPYAFNYRADISDGQTILHFVYGLGLWALVALTMPESTLIGKISTQDQENLSDLNRAA